MHGSGGARALRSVVATRSRGAARSGAAQARQARVTAAVAERDGRRGGPQGLFVRRRGDLGVRARGWEAGVIPGGRFRRQLRCGGDGPAGGATASAALRRGRVTGRLAGGPAVWALKLSAGRAVARGERAGYWRARWARGEAGWASGANWADEGVGRAWGQGKGGRAATGLGWVFYFSFLFSIYSLNSKPNSNKV